MNEPRESKQELQERRHKLFCGILAAYATAHGDGINWRDLTPYCIRVSRRVKRKGRVWEAGEARPEADGEYYTGAEIPIIDLYFTNLLYHNLVENRRGRIAGRWEMFITDTLNKILGHEIKQATLW